MQRQPKGVRVPCVIITALQSWSHCHPAMLSIPLIVSTALQPCPAPPLWEALLPCARQHSFQPHVGECKHAESGPLHPQSSPSGVSHCDNETLKVYVLICVLHG